MLEFLLIAYFTLAFIMILVACLIQITYRLIKIRSDRLIRSDLDLDQHG